jgi:aspartyl-tRNA(Asn)/glutamyl-tRNA(Gln) amidotransferase subunit B
MTSEYEVVIGLEVHAQLATDSKMFATSSTNSGDQPNTHTDPVTMGMPGSLPVVNRKAIDFAIKLGLATRCEIARVSVFSRKHYLYPDLPKGYQISQYDLPLCKNGKLTIRTEAGLKEIGITRIHLEEDAGKNIHVAGENYSLVDLNRAGVPLVEIVSEPDLRSSEEAGVYMRQIRQIVQYLGVCDGNMEEGSLRCDANVSLRKFGATEFGTKVELKNINSFRFVEKAIDFEIKRQTEILNEGGIILQETRLYDDVTNTTRSMRSKEQAADYRYFPDPDLPPLVVDDEWIRRAKEHLPELPEATFIRFQNIYGLDNYYAEILTLERDTAHYYDQAVSAHNNPASVANWITTELFGRLNRENIGIGRSPISPENLARLVELIDADTISGKIGKIVFDEMFTTGAEPEQVIQAKGLKQISDPKLIEDVVSKIVEANPTQAASYREGKTKMFGFFVGQVMKVTEGKANPVLVNEILEKILKA